MTITKRDLLKFAVASGAIVPAFAAGGTALAESQTATPAKGQIIINPRPGVTFHTYLASARGASVTSHVIETERALYLVDCQFLQTGAGELKAYVESLGKPLRRIMLSHPHPDHFSGYARNFGGVDFLTTAKVAEVMDTRWIQSGRIKDLQGPFGSEAPEQFVKPEAGLTTGVQELDGVPMVVTSYEDAESASQLTFHFPEAGALVVQDLSYSNAHHFPLGNNANWIKVLEELQQVDAGLILCGHGMPAGKGTLDNSRRYLTLLQKLVDTEDSAEAVVDALVAEYPNYAARDITRFVARLYKAAH